MYLEAEEHCDHDAGKMTLRPRSTRAEVDEFQLEVDAPEDEDRAGDTGNATSAVQPGGRRLITSIGADTEEVALSANTWDVSLGSAPVHVSVAAAPDDEDAPLQCRRCGARESRNPLFWPLRMGSPFLLSTVTPTVLEHAPPAEPSNDVPFGGRRLLAFSDSRQGSARLAVRLQQESERNYVRSQLLHGIAAARPPGGVSEDDRRRLEGEVAELEKVASGSPTLSAILAEKREQLEAARDESAEEPLGRLSWREAVSQLANSSDIGRMRAEYRRLSGVDIPAVEYAEFCLYREFFRRPRRDELGRNARSGRAAISRDREAGGRPDAGGVDQSPRRAAGRVAEVREAADRFRVAGAGSHVRPGRLPPLDGHEDVPELRAGAGLRGQTRPGTDPVAPRARRRQPCCGAGRTLSRLRVGLGGCGPPRCNRPVPPLGMDGRVPVPAAVRSRLPLPPGADLRAGGGAGPARLPLHAADARHDARRLVAVHPVRQ